LKSIKTFTEATVVCPACNRSVIILFKKPSIKIIFESDMCDYCGEDWAEDIKEQILLDLEDSLEYDDDVESIRQSEYTKCLSESIYELFEN
jgi:hypothetical protein